MNSKKLYIPYVPILDTLDLASNEIVLEEHSLRLPIMINNWVNQYPYIPATFVDLAYSDTGFYFRFQSKGRGLRGVNLEDGDRVHLDSCVEAFIRLPEDDRYYNFEFNVVGACDAAHRKSREDAERFTPQQYDKVHRVTSEKREALFERPYGIHYFFVSAKVDFDLIGIDIERMPEYIMANFYKCGDQTSVPHFASWAPIDVPTPDFHRPEFFEKIYIGAKQ